MPIDLLANEPRDLLADSDKKQYTGNPNIDMADANKEYAQAKYEASPLRMLDKDIAIALNPVTQQILGAAKTMTGGGSSFLEKAGILPKSNPKDAFNQLGQLAGYVPVGNIATQAAAALPGLAGRNLISKIAQDAVAGTAAGYYGTPENRGSGAVGGAFLGGLLPAAATGLGKGVDFLNDIPGALQQIKNNFKNIQNPAQFGRDVREALFNSKKAVSNTFGNELDELAKNNPDRTVDHSDDFGRLNAALNDTENNPGLSTQVKAILNKVRNPDDAATIRKYIDNPSLASKVPLSESQRLKVAIQDAPSIANKLKQGKFADYSTADLEILDLLDNVKLSQSSVFPELTQIRKPYAEYMQNYDIVKNSFKPTQLLNKIRKGFGNEEIDQILNTVLPKKTLNDINGFKKTENFIKKAKTAGTVGLLGAIGGSAYRKYAQ